MVDADLSKQFRQVSINESAKKKSMWLGEYMPSQKHVQVAVMGEGGLSVAMATTTYSGALYKIFDEVLVNAVDAQCKQTADTPRAHRITEIRITFADGLITVANNGNGIPIGNVVNLKGELVSVPELVSTEFLAGSNNDDDAERITGGSHGLGLTLVNNSSAKFTLETCDLEKKLIFRQDTYDRLERKEKAVITKLGKANGTKVSANGTKVSFLPDYAAFGYPSPTPETYATYEPLFRLRAAQVSAHTGLVVYYNGEKLELSVKSYADLHVPHLAREYAYFKLSSAGSAGSAELAKPTEDPKKTWHVVIGTSASGAFEASSIINGVSIPNGSHITYIKDLIVEELKPHAERLLKKYVSFKRAMIQNNLFLIISGKIPSPNYTSQIKDSISDPVAKYKGYTFSKAQIGKIWKMIEPILIEQYVVKSEKAVSTKKGSTTGIKKYRRAELAGTAKSAQCTLLICEGDSAEGMARGAIMSSEVALSFQNTGTFNIGGVPMNGRKKVSITGGRLVRQKALDDNERLGSLAKVLNLKYGVAYADAAEFATLSYGQVVLCVDQDLDGIGQIGGLIVSHFELFWPELIKRRYLKVFATPILRAFPGQSQSKEKEVLSFYSDKEYEEWKREQFGGAEPSAGWTIKYYKGLATHNDKEAIHMFKNYDSQLYTFTYDERCHELFNVYYGKEPELRKGELRLPLEQFVRETPMDITCTEQLRTNTKAAQLDNQIRKLPDNVDGLTRTARKVLAASRIRWARSGEECKVSTLAGYITEKMNYHHGSASLEETITKMAQDFVGANNFPLLLPLSQFGTRYKGGQDAGAPRYIKTKLNKPLVSALFRGEDDWILEYTFDEGNMGEPIRYIPIAPFSIMESLTIPSTGFKYEGYARAWCDIYATIKAKIAGDVNGVLDEPIKPLRFYAKGWKGTERICEKVGRVRSSKTYLMGSYVISAANEIIITELPYGMPIDTFIEALEEIAAGDGGSQIAVMDKSSKTAIRIIVKPKPGVVERWEAEADPNSPDMDAVEEKLKLYRCMTDHLNHINWQGAAHVVKEYGGYGEILDDWFAVRLDAYERRIARECELLRLEILYWGEVIRFVAERGRWEFEKMDEAASVAILAAAGYLRFNKGLLENPRLTPVADLERLIVGSLIEEIPGQACRPDKPTYDYLFNITGRQCMLAARESREKKLLELRAEFEKKTAPGIVMATWLAELAELAEVVAKADAPEGWLYSEPKARFS